MLGFILSAIWWLLVLGAAFESGRAWGLVSAVGILAVLLVVGHLGLFGVIASTVGALWIGYRAEEAMEPAMLDAEP